MDNFSLLTVLVIDPHTLGRRLLREVLKSQGVGTVVTAETAKKALELFHDIHLDAAFIDWSPATDALGFIAAVRADDKANPFLPIVVASPFGDLDHVRQARDAGASEFLLKPFTPHAVTQRLRSVVETPRRFVMGGNFFGPDRRRHHTGWDGTERRSQTQYVDRRFHEETIGVPERRSRGREMTEPAPLSPNEVIPTSNDLGTFEWRGG